MPCIHGSTIRLLSQKLNTCKEATPSWESCQIWKTVTPLKAWDGTEGFVTICLINLNCNVGAGGRKLSQFAWRHLQSTPSSFLTSLVWNLFPSLVLSTSFSSHGRKTNFSLEIMKFENGPKKTQQKRSFRNNFFSFFQPSQDLSPIYEEIHGGSRSSISSTSCSSGGSRSVIRWHKIKQDGFMKAAWMFWNAQECCESVLNIEKVCETLRKYGYKFIILSRYVLITNHQFSNRNTTFFGSEEV